MRRTTTLLAVSTLALSLTSGYLYIELTAAREQARRVAANESDIEPLRTRREAPLLTSRLEPPFVAAPPIAPSSPDLTAPAVASSIAPRNPLLPPNADLIELTDEKRLLITRRLYRSIFGALALSDAEIAAVLPVLVAQDSPRDVPRLSSQEKLERDQAELATLLGAEKAERFTAARRLLPARNTAMKFRRQLEDSGEPLSAEQQEALVQVLAPVLAESPPEMAEGDDPERANDRFNGWMRDHEARMNQTAAEVLTATQRRTLEEDETFRLAMGRRAGAILTPQAGSSASVARTR